MGDHGQPDGAFIQAFGRSRPADPAAVFEAGVLSDSHLPARRATGKKFADSPGEVLHILAIQFGPADSFPFLAAGSDLTVGQTFFFSLLQGFAFYQQSLPFVALAGPAPFQHHRA